MPFSTIGIIEDVNKFTGKNGFGATITISALIDKRRKSVQFNINSSEYASIFEEHLQEEMEVTIMILQSNFGMRFGEIIKVTPLN